MQRAEDPFFRVPVGNVYRLGMTKFYISANLSNQFAATANHRFEFHKRSQLLIRTLSDR
jgi:hypothetical protein